MSPNFTRKQCRKLYALLKVLTKIFTLFVSVAAGYDAVCDVMDDGELNQSKQPLHDLVQEGCSVVTKLRSLINNL